MINKCDLKCDLSVKGFAIETIIKGKTLNKRPEKKNLQPLFILQANPAEENENSSEMINDKLILKHSYFN